MKHFRMLKGIDIYLSPISSDDVETYCEWTNDLETMLKLGIADKPNAVSPQRDMLKAMEKQYAFAIMTQDHEVIGTCSLHQVDFINDSASLGIFIGPPTMRNKGYGKEAIVLLCHYGFSVLNLHSITLTVFGFNEHAVKVYEKVGFKETGRRTESYFFDGKYYDIIYMECFEKTLTHKPLDRIFNTIKL